MDEPLSSLGEIAPEIWLKSIVDHIVDGIVGIDERGCILTFNPAAERLFGYQAAEMIGQNVNVLMPEPYRSAHNDYVANYLRTGQRKIICIGREVTATRQDGSEFPIDLAVSTFRIGNRHYFTGIVRDITQRKALESELHRRFTELARADRQ